MKQTSIEIMMVSDTDHKGVRVNLYFFIIHSQFFGSFLLFSG